MRNVISAVTLAALLLGCSSKEERHFLSVYEKNKNYHLQLLKTEKTELNDGIYTKALLTATYLYRPLKNSDAASTKRDTRDEAFIVGLYFDDEEESGSSLKRESLSIDGKHPKSVKALSKSDPRLKSISFVSEWSSFYLVTFPHTDKTSFDMVFEDERYGKGTLHFAKVAKYVLTKTPF